MVMDLMTHPACAALAPYPLMALKAVLTPSHHELLLPLMTVTISVPPLILFLAVGWWRVATRTAAWVARRAAIEVNRSVRRRNRICPRSGSIDIR